MPLKFSNADAGIAAPGSPNKWRAMAGSMRSMTAVGGSDCLPKKCQPHQASWMPIAITSSTLVMLARRFRVAVFISAV